MDLGRTRLVALVVAAGLTSALPAIAAGDTTTGPLRSEIYAPVSRWIEQLKDVKNEHGKPKKVGTYSRIPHKTGDASYEVAVHVNTAEADRQVTERYTLTVGQKDGKWAVVKEEVADTYVGLFRETGATCYPFDAFHFDREGLKLSGSSGNVCETYREGKVAGFALSAAGLTYSYEPPAHASLVQTGHDFYAVHRIMAKDHAKELAFTPAAIFFSCDGQTCDELLAGSFEGLSRIAPELRAQVQFGDSAPAWLKPSTDRLLQERRDSAFAHFRARDDEGHRYYNVVVAREVAPLDWGFLEEALPGSGVALSYDSWGSWEVTFAVLPRQIDGAAQFFGEQLFGVLYGYFTEETTKATEPYDLERREPLEERFYEVTDLTGTIDLGLTDPEMIEGDVRYTLTLKQPMRELPFFIAAFGGRSAFGRDKPAPLFVNAIQLAGKDLTWVRVGRFGGRVILPETMPAGAKLDLRMNYAARGMVKYTPSYTDVNRFGWLPFVTFGDFIDDFQLTLRAPSKYTILGIGHKTSERIEGDVVISQWKADQPVVFPSIILGRYRSDTSSFDAKKANGTIIPVSVHVDDASFVEWGIRPDSLRPIAEQAANAINLYTSVSGLEYPYGELNLVNDAKGGLYGQAPSSLIYLGAGVFRGAGYFATLKTFWGEPIFNNPAGISTFLRSVTAHEVGHQWWGSRVSNSNDRNYWFVESLAEYFSAIYLEAMYGYPEYQKQIDEWRSNIVNARLKGSVQNASTLDSGNYQASVYSKGPYAFHMLREIYKGQGPRGPAGADKKFFDALKVFSRELAAKREIVTLDIQHAAEKALGGIDADGQPYNADLAWFFDQWIRGSGIPQYALFYEVRETEDGGYLIEGRVKQRVVIGDSRGKRALDGTYYRGVVDLVIEAKGGPFLKRLVIDGAETPFKLKVPHKPLEVALNKTGEILAHDVLINKDW